MTDEQKCLEWLKHRRDNMPMAGAKRMFGIAISAIQRLEPKQPVWKEIDITNDGVPCKNAFCPVCEAEYEPDDIDRIGFDYCYSCGQALNWGDEA